MIKLELVEEKTYFGKWFINSRMRWQNSESGLPVKSIIEHDKIKREIWDKCIKITCGLNEYLVAGEKIKGKDIQYLSSSENDEFNESFEIYKSKPDELYICLRNDVVDMKKSGTLTKDFLIKIVNKNSQSVEYYGVMLVLTYKNPNIEDHNIEDDIFRIDVSASQYSLSNIDFLGYTVDISFFSLLSFWLYTFFTGINKFGEALDYVSIAIFVTYVFQIIIKSIYIKNTWLNFLIDLFKRKNRKRREITKSKFVQRIFKAHKDYIEENKTKSLSEL